MKRRKILLLGGTFIIGSVAGCAEEGGDEGSKKTTQVPEEEQETVTTDEPEDTAGTEDGETGDTIVYGNLYAFESNYAVEVEYSDPESGESGKGSAKYYGDDYYMQVRPDESGDMFEVYHIENDDYYVINEDACYLNPGPAMEPDSDIKEESDAEGHGSKPDADLEPKGTTEIDGETVYIFEVTGEDVDGTLTLYVSASTGYLRRAEGEWGTADFYSWGEIDPISKPNMDCQEF